ncbi:MAG: hypothetical protein QOE61_5209, partial [Micromonosporaceae bacterium]|nr:hypothetical protein [Micromonosporaceae bacterium]
IVVTVSAAGVVTAKTEELFGERCLDYIDVLEDLLEARTVESAYTADYSRGRTETGTNQEEHDVDHA